MSLISDFREPTRAFLGDFNVTVRKYQDSSIDSVVRTIVLCGHLPLFLLSSDKLSITPDIVQPSDFAKVVYRTCVSFVRPNAARYGYNRRAMGERFGDQYTFLFELENALYDLENGDMFSSFSNFASWAQAITGIDVWAFMTDMKVRAPVATVSLGRDGLKVSR